MPPRVTDRAGERRLARGAPRLCLARRSRRAGQRRGDRGGARLDRRLAQGGPPLAYDRVAPGAPMCSASGYLPCGSRCSIAFFARAESSRRGWATRYLPASRVRRGTWRTSPAARARCRAPPGAEGRARPPRQQAALGAPGAATDAACTAVLFPARARPGADSSPMAKPCRAQRPGGAARRRCAALDRRPRRALPPPAPRRGARRAADGRDRAHGAGAALSPPRSDGGFALFFNGAGEGEAAALADLGLTRAEVRGRTPCSSAPDGGFEEAAAKPAQHRRAGRLRRAARARLRRGGAGRHALLRDEPRRAAHRRQLRRRAGRAVARGARRDGGAHSTLIVADNSRQRAPARTSRVAPSRGVQGRARRASGELLDLAATP